MEKLFRRADGYSEASDGNFAVVPLRRTGIEGDDYFFAFKPSFNAQSIRVEWPMDSAIATIPSDVAMTMIRLGHARNLTKDEVEQFNDAVEFDGDDAEANRKAAEEAEANRKAAEEAEANRLAEEKRLNDEAEANRKAAEEADAENEVEDEEEPEDGTEKPKRGRKKKEAETPATPIGIPGLTS